MEERRRVSLSDHERVSFDAIADHLVRDDPGFAGGLGRIEPGWRRRLTGVLRYVWLGLGMAGVACGMAPFANDLLEVYRRGFRVR